jgi:hypothetical protein
MVLATRPDKEDVIDYAYVVYPVYEGERGPDIPVPQPPEFTTYSGIYITLFDTTGVNKVTQVIDEGNSDIVVSHPCVAVTPADLIHICWQRNCCVSGDIGQIGHLALCTL